MDDLRRIIVQMIRLSDPIMCLEALEEFEWDRRNEELDEFDTIVYEELKVRYMVCGARQKYENWYFGTEEE